MMPVQTTMDQLGGGYYLFGQGHGVNQDPSWPTMSQNQSFLGPWSQMPQLTTATSLVTTSHTGIPSPTSSSHVGDWLTTSACHVEDSQPTTTSHAGGIALVAMSHPDITSPASDSHVESMSPAIVNDVGGIHTIEKPGCVRCNPKFLYRICEGDHLTHLCPSTVGIPEAWSSPRGPSSSESSLVSLHFISPLIDMATMPMQSSPDPTPIFESGASHGLVVTHPIQPMVEEVVIPMQSLVNPTLLLEGDASFNLVISISSIVPSEQERVLLSPSTLPRVLERFPLTGMVWWVIQFLLPCLFK
jgi:hypothetical protein